MKGGTQEPWVFRAIGFLILLGLLIWFLWKWAELFEALPT